MSYQRTRPMMLVVRSDHPSPWSTGSVDMEVINVVLVCPVRSCIYHDKRRSTRACGIVRVAQAVES